MKHFRFRGFFPNLQLTVMGIPGISRGTSQYAFHYSLYMYLIYLMKITSMRHKFTLSIFSLWLVVIANAQNVGIGTATPLARLHVTDSSVLFSAAGDIPATA